MGKTLWDVGQEWWAQVTQKVKRAVVYLDPAMAEMLHWSGGMSIFLQAGAHDVREFSSFENGDDSQQKAVILVSSALSDTVTESVLSDIVTGSKFQYVVLFTTVSPLLHTSGEGEDWEGLWEEKLLQWMGNMNYTVEVRHIPMFAAEVCPYLFIAPMFSQVFPLLTADVKQVAYQHSITSHLGQDSRSPTSLSELEMSHLSPALQAKIQEMASGLHAMLQGLDVKEDIYSIGHTSRLIATQLEQYPSARSRRKNTQYRASLVLLDRSLDLTPVLTHQADTLLDRLTNTLPGLAGHDSDRLVDMTALTNVNKESALSTSQPRVILPGSLAPSSGAQRPSHLTSLVTKKQKEAIMEINRKLVEAATSEKLPLNLGGSRPGRVSADLLDTTMSLFRGKYPLIRKHLNTLQIAMATSKCLHGASCDAVTAAEKNLLQALVDGMEENWSGNSSSQSPSAMVLLSRLVEREMRAGVDEREMNLDDLLCLLTLTYSLSGGDCGDEDEAAELRENIAQWILKDSSHLPPVAKKIFGAQVTEGILRDQIESLWQRLEAVGDAREDLTQFSSVLDSGDDMSPASVKPLLTQVIEAVLDPAKPDLPDVECKSGGLSKLLKSGFGFFTGSSGKSRPGDAPLLILFVIGGVTSAEVKQVKDAVDKAGPQFEVLVGGTRLASIESTLESVFTNDNVNVSKL